MLKYYAKSEQIFENAELPDILRLVNDTYKKETFKLFMC